MYALVELHTASKQHTCNVTNCCTEFHDCKAIQVIYHTPIACFTLIQYITVSTYTLNIFTLWLQSTYVHLNSYFTGKPRLDIPL